MTIYPITVINLAERKDRFEAVKQELQRNNIVFQRFEAYTGGWSGCAKGHIELNVHGVATSRKWYMICEDDIEFITRWSELKPTIEQVIKQYDPDVFMLYRSLPNDSSLERDTIPGISRVKCALGGACYIVNKNYGLKLAHHLQDRPKMKLDEAWQSLQKSDKWYTFTEPVVRQVPGYSDIEEKNVNYDYLL